MSSNLGAFRKELGLTIKPIPEGKDYARPNGPRVATKIKADANGKERVWLLLAVPMQDTQVTNSKAGKSVILAGLNFRPFVTSINGINVTVGASQGKVWAKPAGRDEQEFPF